MEKLTKEENEILRAYEAGELKRSKSEKADIQRAMQAARATLKKDKRVNIRLSSADLLGVQRRAVEEGLPYQSLMTSIIHKYVTGTLISAPH